MHKQRLRNRLSAILTRLHPFFLAPSDGRALAAVRIALGGAILAEALLVYPFLHELYGQFGFLQADLIEALTGRAIPGFLLRAGVTGAGYDRLLELFYLAHVSAALAFLAGFRTRAATVALWLTQTVLLNSGYYSSYGVDRYFQNLLFLLALFPAVPRWSLDAQFARSRPAPRASWTLGWRCVQLFLLLTYADAGISKSLGTDWWNGEAIWRVLNQPEFRRFDFLWLAGVPWLPKLLGIGTMVVEAGYLLAAFVPRLGTAWTCAILSLHLGIAATMNGLTLFGLSLAAVNAALFLVPLLPDAAAAREAKRTRLLPLEPVTGAFDAKRVRGGLD